MRFSERMKLIEGFSLNPPTASVGCGGKSLKSNFIIYEVLAWAKLYGNMFLYFTRFECFLKETVQVVLYGLHDFNFMSYTSLFKKRKIFVFLTYFTLYDTLQVHPCPCK